MPDRPVAEIIDPRPAFLCLRQQFGETWCVWPNCDCPGGKYDLNTETEIDVNNPKGD